MTTMWESAVSTDIAAPAEVVYRYLSDFERHKEWSLGVAEMEPLANGPVSVGKEFKASETTPVKFTSFARITTLEPPERIAWEAWDNRVMKVQWAFEMSSRDGTTHLVERSQWQPTNLLGTVIFNLMRKRQIPRENQKSLGRIRAILESGTQMNLAEGSHG
jgi:uncharacterized membrane protein